MDAEKFTRAGNREGDTRSVNSMSITSTRQSRDDERHAERPKEIQKEEELELNLPDIPDSDLTLDFSSFMTSSSVNETLNKRASNVMKLSQENEKLEAELKAMSERLESMERRRAQLSKENNVEKSSS